MKLFSKMQARFIPQLLTALLLSTFILSACTPAVSTTTLPNPTATSAPLVTAVPTATLTPVATAVPTSDGSVHLALDAGSIATTFQTETVAAVPASDNVAYWDVLPQYIRVTLDGYPLSTSSMKPQFFIYPVKNLVEANQSAGQVVASLKTLLQSPQEIPNMPFLPLVNEQQVIHAQVQYLDFESGQGVRYLTEFAQGIVPITNSSLIYTCQGLTSDGKYYVSAVLPVNHPSLPVDENATANIPLEFATDYPAYLSNVFNTLNTVAANTYTPDLTQLDAMMSSLEIK